jgi:hypothetical protein
MLPATERDSRYALRYRVGVIIGASFFIILAARLLRLTYRYSVNIFFWDQWEFNNATLFQKHSAWQMFRWQHGPHRLGLGPLLSKMIEPYFHWNSRVESFVACGVVILAAACALWLKKRLFGDISIWDASIPIVYFSATQYESLFINSNLAHGPLPLLLITLYCLAWTVPDIFTRYVLVLALNFVTINTGFGLFLGFITPLLLVLDWVNLRTKPRARFYFAIALLIACASVALFFYGYTVQPAVSCFSFKLQTPLRYLWYVSLMFAHFFGVRGVDQLSILIGCLVILWLLWTLVAAVRSLLNSGTQSWIQHVVPTTLVGYSLLFSINAAIGRLCLGFGSAQASRYSNYLALGIFGAYLHLLSFPALRLRRVLLAVAMAALLTTLPIRAQDRGLMGFFSDIKRTWRSCYLAGGSISECDKEAGYQIVPEPEDVLREKLNYLKRTGNNLYSGST